MAEGVGFPVLCLVSIISNSYGVFKDRYKLNLNEVEKWNLAKTMSLSWLLYTLPA